MRGANNRGTKEDNMPKKFGCFVAGGLIGAAAALLFAPRPGDETRAIITDWASNACGNSSGVPSRVRDLGTAVVHDAVPSYSFWNCHTSFWSNKLLIVCGNKHFMVLVLNSVS